MGNGRKHLGSQLEASMRKRGARMGLLPGPRRRGTPRVGRDSRFMTEPLLR